ncbi:outer membrane beta-barrel protein [Spirosoma sp. HMF4905]|uniref:Outer membrane beta-barrel protein n=1 Tax=Spirosoma arboris TaxID=2682092 RepID=A0A7K1SG16_9BACT|nr:porin family protein [Spirosoma arboris]MVM32765.1 outer membrane beta-barrel protein [Spirosoma arboris]
MKTATFFHYLCLLLVAILIESCTPRELSYLMPEASADKVNQEYYGPSYKSNGSGSQASSDELAFNFGIIGVFELAGMLDNDGKSSENKQPSYGSLLASNRPGLQPGLYRPYSPARPKADDIKTHLAIMSGLELIGKGARESDAGGTTNTRLLYLELPVYAIYHHDLTNKGRIFGGLGPYFAYGLSGSFKSSFSGQSFSTPAFGGNGGYKRFDAGLALTAGYQFPSSLRIRLAYDLGLANIESGPSGPDYDKTHNRALSVNVGYALDKIVSKFKKR